VHVRVDQPGDDEVIGPVERRVRRQAGGQLPIYPRDPAVLHGHVHAVEHVLPVLHGEDHRVLDQDPHPGILVSDFRS
jgi:hypothetical protein